jgi:hypothetical protein
MLNFCAERDRPDHDEVLAAVSELTETYGGGRNCYMNNRGLNIIA